MNRTRLDEHFRIKRRGKWYEPAEEIQAALDVFLEFYNLKRSHHGYRFKGENDRPGTARSTRQKKLPPIIPKAEEAVVIEAVSSDLQEIPSVG